MDERYAISFLVDDRPEVEAVVDACLEVGLTTTPDGQTDRCAEYDVVPADSDRVTHRDVPLSDAVDDLSMAPAGDITLWYDEAEETRLKLRLRGDADSDWRSAKLEIDFQTVPIDPSFETEDVSYTRAEVQERVETIYSLAVALAERFEPNYVWSEISTRGGWVSDQRPTERPMDEDIDWLGWITVLSPDLVEQFGGREYILDAPAWGVEELDSGHVVIAAEDHPFDPTEHRRSQVVEYVLAGRDEG